MMPLRFGSAGRRLYAVFHPPAARRTPPRAALLCNAFGQEAVRTHRLYRLLAERLAREGANVLRFDYFATGESDGDDQAGDLEGWCDDILTADAELRRRSGAPRCAWFGARLGGTLAAVASARAEVAPERLVLWEPVADGAAYLQELARSHARATHDPYRESRPPAVVDIADEAIGFGVGTTLRSQLAALQPGSSRVASPVTLTARPGQSEAGRLAGAWRSQGATVNEATLAHDLVWAAEEAMNTALAPAEAIAALQRQLLGEPA